MGSSRCGPISALTGPQSREGKGKKNTWSVLMRLCSTSFCSQASSSINKNVRGYYYYFYYDAMTNGICVCRDLGMWLFLRTGWCCLLGQLKHGGFFHTKFFLSLFQAVFDSQFPFPTSSPCKSQQTNIPELRNDNKTSEPNVRNSNSNTVFQINLCPSPDPIQADPILPP